jgi:hypothetical protein
MLFGLIKEDFQRNYLKLKIVRIFEQGLLNLMKFKILEAHFFLLLQKKENENLKQKNQKQHFRTSKIVVDF